jgi:undecaprenyl-diphosphatase
MFAVGFIMAFASAWICVQWLLRYISSHRFTVFAWYRIAFGVIVLATHFGGWVDWGG